MAMSKAEALAIDNMAIFLAARAEGMEIHPDDLAINYAEIDHELTSREDAMVRKSSERILARIQEWLAGISDPADVTIESLGLDEILAEETLEHIKSVWIYGGDSADRELQGMGLSAAEDWENLTNDDAFEWYDRYAKALATSGEDSLFMRMQPFILAAIEEGVVRMALSRVLSEEFARYGSVRADIIARTESNKAFNWGRRYRFDQSAVLAGYRYSAILDARTTPICSALHGSSWTREDPNLNNYTPPNHYRCRSVLVPISKYVDHQFQGPPSGWEDSLPESQRKVLDKFKDTAWYPTPGNIRSLETPTPGAKKPKPPATKRKPKAATPPPSPAAAAPPPSASAAEIVQRSIAESQKAARQDVEKFIEHNLARGITRDRLKDADDLLAELEQGYYDGIMITAEWDARNKSYYFREYSQVDGGAVFVWKDPKMKKADADKILERVEDIKNDPAYTGVKIQLGATKGDSIANYMAGKDRIIMSNEIKESDILRVFHHEIGHRVHNIPDVYASGIHQDNIPVRVPDGRWSDWKDITEKYWTNERTPVGSDILPEDMAARWNYPINAKYYYNNGSKDNFHKEMFAESSSVYLQQDPEEVAKVRRTFPDLMEFMESVYERGYIQEEREDD